MYGWVFNGIKCFIMNGVCVNMIIMFVMINCNVGCFGIWVFCVEYDMLGFLVMCVEYMVGLWVS